jgi:hypothetical protein
MIRMTPQFLVITCVCFAALTSSGCETVPLPVTPSPTDEPSAYAGSASCQPCHGSIYYDYVGSGHAEQFKRIADGLPPQYARASVMDYPVGTPPPGTDWDSIEYVLGGTGSYALFVGTDGLVVSGDSAQWELTTGEWTSYAPAGQIGLDCGACHATGYVSQGGADANPSTWELDGIACESCHGPGRAHTISQLASDIVVDRSSESCDRCHDHGHTSAPHSSGHGSQFGVECLTCHDPHISARFDWDRAILKDCIDCHTSDQ